MVRPLGVSFDVGVRKPRRLELLIRVKARLIQIVRRLRVGVFAEYQDGTGLDRGGELDHADERVAGHAVPPLLSLLRVGVEIEYDALGTWASGHREAGLGIAERFLTAGLNPLYPIDVSP